MMLKNHCNNSRRKSICIITIIYVSILSNQLNVSASSVSCTPPPHARYLFFQQRKQSSSGSSSRRIRLQDQFTRRKEKLLSTSSSILKNVSEKTKNIRKDAMNGYYYGLTEEFLRRDSPNLEERSSSSNDGKSIYSPVPNSKPSLAEEMKSTLFAFRSKTDDLRYSLEELEKKMDELLERLADDEDFIQKFRHDGLEDSEPYIPAAKRERLKQFEEIADDVERWAAEMFREGREEGWEDIRCSALFRSAYKNHKNVECSLKYLPNVAILNATSPQSTVSSTADDVISPCIKVKAVIDAPLSKVTQFLSQPSNKDLYNSLLVSHSDVEQVASHAKICWATTIKLLGVPSRDFVTFCHLRWKKDGTQVITNRAVDHHDRPAVVEGKKISRAHALRGANIIAPLEGDEKKTIVAIVGHAHPGGNLPEWIVRAAVNTVLPMEPFKLMHKIEQGTKKMMKEEENKDGDVTAFVRYEKNAKKRPGGMSQLGYASFWPEGGGLEEKGGESWWSSQSQYCEEDDTSLDDDIPFSQGADSENETRL